MIYSIFYRRNPEEKAIPWIQGIHITRISIEIQNLLISQEYKDRLEIIILKIHKNGK